MGAARMVLSAELLAEALRLPAGMRVTHAWDSMQPGCVEVSVEHEALPAAPVDGPLPVAECIFTAAPTTCGEPHIKETTVQVPGVVAVIEHWPMQLVIKCPLPK